MKDYKQTGKEIWVISTIGSHPKDWLINRRNLKTVVDIYKVDHTFKFARLVSIIIVRANLTPCS